MRASIPLIGGVLVLVTLATPATASALPVSGSAGQITDVRSDPGKVQFVLTAGQLPQGAVLDPASVKVTAGLTPLSATASPTQNQAAVGKAPIREVILTLDVSGSMAGSGIAAARTAAVAYANKLPADVRVGVVTFSDKPRTLLAPTRDRAVLTAAISRVQAGGATALYDGIITAIRSTQGLPADAERRLVILSDGDDTSSTHSLIDATSSLLRGGIAADVVAFRLPGDQTVLAQIAAASHGSVLPALNAGRLASAFEAAADAFRQQVLVTVKVPSFMAGKTTQLATTMLAGSERVVAQVQITLPIGSGGGTSPDVKPTNIASAAALSSTTLWIVCGVVFLVLFVLAMLALYGPMTARARSSKQARLAEIHRYRLLGALDRARPAVSTGPAEGNVTRTTLSLVDKAVRARGQRERLVEELDRAGLRMRPEEWAVLQVCAVIVLAALLGVLTQSPVGLIIGAVLGWLTCRFFVRAKTSRRAKAFEDQLPDTLQLLAGSLRSGFSLGQSFTGVVREGTEPTASEFARALAEVRLGSELEDAIEAVAERMKCQDLHWVVMAVRISREVGGNLAEVLGNTVTTMRQRAELRGQVRVLSAEGRISARVLVGLPIMVTGFLLAFRPGYLSPLFHTASGIAMLAAGIVFLALGSFWLSRLVKIEV